MAIQVRTNKTRNYDLEKLLLSYGYTPYDELADYATYDHIYIDTDDKDFLYLHEVDNDVREDQVENILLMLSLGMKEDEILKALEE